MHDGRLVICPTRALAGRCYQKLVETAQDGQVCDLRTACVGGAPVSVSIKTRAASDRFASGANLLVSLADPKDVFSTQERERIAAFNAAVGLEWGTLDILRDVQDGRIYIVDVNKTDVGPVLQLSMRDKVAATRALSLALLDMISAGPRRQLTDHCLLETNI